jgi:hypothetical protein
MGRVRGPGEPRWTEEDTALAVEWQRLQQETCGGCGHLLEESLDEATEYEVRSLVCFACQAKEQAEKALHDNERAATAGRKLVAVRVGSVSTTTE